MIDIVISKCSYINNCMRVEFVGVIKSIGKNEFFFGISIVNF